MEPDRDARVPLREAFVSPEAKRRYNQRMFGIISPRYDLITRLLSYGQDQRWKDRLVAEAEVRPGHPRWTSHAARATSRWPLAAGGARVVGLDLTLPMLRARRPPPRRAGRPLVAGDMACLPVPRPSVDLVTAS